jgi:hypothetical protein
MAVHVFGEAIVGNVGAKLQGPLKVGRLEGVVHDKEEVLMLFHHVGHGLNVHDLIEDDGGTVLKESEDDNFELND